jgi:hypothetical protein
MKTGILLLMLFVGGTAKAKINPDSVLQSAFKPEMENYLKRITELTSRIAATASPDSVRYYAKKMMKLSDKMEEKVNTYYHYRGSHTQLASLFFYSGKTTGISYALLTVNGGPAPLATSYVNEIYDCASRIRFLWSKNPKRIKRNISRIFEIREKLLMPAQS